MEIESQESSSLVINRADSPEEQFLVFRAAVKGESDGKSCSEPGIELPSGRDRSILYIGLQDTVGALTSAIDHFKTHGINMGCINRCVFVWQRAKSRHYLTLLLPFIFFLA